MATCPAARLMMLAGMKKGDTRPIPFSSIRSRVSMMLVSPPIPDPMITPVFSGSGTVPSGPSPADLIASSAATTAYWMKVSIRRASLRSITGSAENPFTSAAIEISGASPGSSHLVSGPTPLRPASAPLHVSVAVHPSGVTMPTPVTTTLRFM
jgi:hypothetical protein